MYIQVFNKHSSSLLQNTYISASMNDGDDTSADRCLFPRIHPLTSMHT